VSTKGAPHDGEDTERTLRTIIWYQRACISNQHDKILSQTAGKWRKCESYFGALTLGSQLWWAMNWMDWPRTSADERMLSGCSAVVIA